MPRQVEAVVGFLPVVRPDDKLVQGHDGGDPHERPAGGNGKHPGNKVELLTLCAGNETEVHIEEIARDQADDGWIENRRDIEEVELGSERLPFRDVQAEKRPHEGIHEEGGGSAADDGEQREHLPDATLKEVVPWAAQMNQ